MGTLVVRRTMLDATETRILSFFVPDNAVPKPAHSAVPRLSVVLLSTLACVLACQPAGDGTDDTSGNPTTTNMTTTPIGECVPGKQRDCECPDGSLGKQSCLSDGNSWGTCFCGVLGESSDTMSSASEDTTVGQSSSDSSSSTGATEGSTGESSVTGDATGSSTTSGTATSGTTTDDGSTGSSTTGASTTGDGSTGDGSTGDGTTGSSTTSSSTTDESSSGLDTSDT